MDTDRTLKNLERKFQTKLKEKVQELFLRNEIKGSFVEVEQYESENCIKQEPMYEQLVIEEVVDEEQEMEEIFVTEVVDEEMAPTASENYVEVLEEYLEFDAHDTLQFELSPKREFSCLRCKPSVSFKYEIGLKIHEWDYHQMGFGDPLVCSTCNYTFDSAANKPEWLARHTQKHFAAHAAGKMSSCMLCPEVFKSHRQVEEHRNRHHLKQAANKCKGCQGEFQSNDELQVHLASSDCRENHERPFKCYICNETFAMGITKKKHIQTDHQDKAGADCKLCLRCKIPSAVAFENHYKTHFARKS